MSKKNRYYLLGSCCLVIAMLILFFYQPSSTQVETVLDTLTLQQEVDQTLSQTIEEGSYSFDEPYVILNPYQN